GHAAHAAWSARNHSAERGFSLAHGPGHVGHAAVHLKELVDVGDLYAGALGDASAAFAVDEIWLGALRLRHGTDDADLTGDLLVVQGCVADLVLYLLDAGQHTHDAFQATDLDQLTELLLHVVEVEFSLGQFLGHLLRLRVIDLFGGLFYEPDNVALAKNAAR